MASLGLLAGPPAAQAQTPDFASSFTFTANMQPLGFSARTVPLENAAPNAGQYNSDLAFWGDKAYQGSYNGFRIIDISVPGSPVQMLNYEACGGNQGDVMIWADLLIRSWNSPANATATCGGELVGQGFEGFHFFDVSNPAAPRLIKALRMAADTTPTTGCGSHTATLVPDVARGNLYIYDSASSGSCPGIDIVRVPMANPTAAEFLRREPAGRSCHDTTVILDKVNLVACAGGNGFTVFSVDPSIAPPAAGSLEDPIELYSKAITGVTIGHSTTFSWDGATLVFGHEPGGGTQARCQSTSTVVDRTLFFFDARTGSPAGEFVHPRPQTNTENCTWHNFNVVPTTNGRDILVSGNYQSGISVLDFTNPAAVTEIASADPAPLINPANAAAIESGGDWSSYWYDGYVYESDMVRGLLVWRLDDAAVAGARSESHSNPQTMYTSLSGAPANGGASGSVPATLSLTIGAPASFGAFTPGVARDYFASTTANVISTAGDAVLSLADPSSTATGHLVNGSFSLPQALQARARNAANTGTAYNNVGSAASPLNLLAYDGPISNDAVSLEFKQSIGANDALRTGAYSKTLTFTLSTTNP
jgi:hypothetical protein